MDVTKVAIDKHQAKELYQAYKAHQQYGDELDREIQRTYRLISQGRVIIQALESIRQAGLNDQGFPKLAVGRATQKACFLHGEPNGSAVMDDGRSRSSRVPSRNRITFPRGTFPFPVTERTSGRHVWQTAPCGKAIAPIIPIHLRPKQAIDEYHILWEAEWEPIPPRDPYLLRRIGKADLWLVCAAWDLTEVERAAMSTRISAA